LTRVKKQENTATQAEANEFAAYVEKGMNAPKLPCLVKTWEADIDSAYEALVLAKPVIDLRKLKKTIDAAPNAWAENSKLKTIVEGRPRQAPCLLVFIKGVRGQLQRNASGVVTEDEVMLSTAVPGPERRKFFGLVPTHLRVQ